MKYRWTIAPPQTDLALRLAGQLAISPLLAQCLLNRGHVEPERISRFLTPKLANLADPQLLPQMDAAVDRLFRARAECEPLVIFGDYDVDGVTSTALLYEFLNSVGWKAECYLPHRIEEGYGLSQVAVEKCLSKHSVKLVLAVDCGSASREQIAWMNERGIDSIVLDHHQVCSPAPEAVALVNPQLSRAAGGVGQFTELCSVGLAFKLCHALLKRGRAEGLPAAQEFDLRSLLDLVALGTVADLVPLVGENRILVTSGLQRLSTTQRPGLVALKEVAGIAGPVGAYEVGFQLGPRLNAAGRLETAEDALKLLLARSVPEAMPLARSLDECNRGRQQIERTISQEIIASLRSRFDAQRDFVVVEGEQRWHIGVVGIVASRVLGEYYRPTLILGGDGDYWRGSGRSVEGFDMAAALRECGDLLLRHGGHAMAAGVTIAPDKLDQFRDRMNSLARQTLQPEQLQKPLSLDAEVATTDLTLDRLHELQRIQHTGIGNPAVNFCLRGASHARALQRMGAEKQHAKMWITDGKRTCEAVLWGVGDGSLPIGSFDLAFSPQINTYNNNQAVQLKVIDWKAAGGDATML